MYVLVMYPAVTGEKPMRHAKFSIVGSYADRIIIKDDGPWNLYPTITNDPEWAVEQMADVLNGRHLLYIDSEGRMDQLRVNAGHFAGFALAPK